MFEKSLWPSNLPETIHWVEKLEISTAAGRVEETWWNKGSLLELALNHSQKMLYRLSHFLNQENQIFYLGCMSNDSCFTQKVLSLSPREVSITLIKNWMYDYFWMFSIKKKDLVESLFLQVSAKYSIDWPQWSVIQLVEELLLSERANTLLRISMDTKILMMCTQCVVGF